MLITIELDETPSGGRQLLCKLNYHVLQDLYPQNFLIFELPIRKSNGLGLLLNTLRGHIDGLTKDKLQAILTTIHHEKISKVFVDGSNLGSAVKLIKLRYPNVEISTFFHNVESRFFYGSFIRKKSIRALAVLLVNYLAERKAVQFSDKVICLSNRDNNLLKKLYGRGATHLSPMALEDKFPFYLQQNTNLKTENFALFVGGLFYANEIGITWFVQNVVPKISMRIYIVGKGFEKLKSQLEVSDNVTVIGAVDNLTEWYKKASFVIAPIFDGSGMKTKVAEALMYGKRIIGSPEAFTGYEDIIDEVGTVCNNAGEFVIAISEYQSKEIKPFDPDVRAIYESNYSYLAAKLRFAAILN